MFFVDVFGPFNFLRREGRRKRDWFGVRFFFFQNEKKRKQKQVNQAVPDLGLLGWRNKTGHAHRSLSL